MIKKTDIAIKAFNDGDTKEALRIAKGFRRGLTRDEMAKLSRGYECLVRPDFYLSLGKDPQKAVEEAISVFRDKFVKE